MDAVADDDPGRPPAPPRSYDLHFREGPRGGFVWRYRDAGIVLTPTAMEWRTDGVARTTDYSTIESIRLQTGNVPKSGTFGACQVTFRNGRTLVINSMNSWGTPDPERFDDYAEFLQDFHERLSEEDRRRIRFLAGATEGRQMFARISVWLGGAFFVLLPLVVMLLTGEIEALFLCIAGLAFIVPALRTLRKNEPRTYDPRHLDDDLFPHT